MSRQETLMWGGKSLPFQKVPFFLLPLAMRMHGLRGSNDAEGRKAGT
jgi:hypothetical protein